VHHPIPKKAFMVDLMDGWRVFRRNRGLVHISLFVIVINTCASVFEIQSIFIVKDRLAFSSSQVGFMMSMLGCGGFAGSFLAGKCRRKFGLGNSLYMLAVGTIVAILIPMLKMTDVSFYVGFFMLGIVSIIFNIMVWSYRQESTEAIFMGRIAGISGSIFKIGMPVGLSLSGFVLTSFGIQALFCACALPLLIAIPPLYRYSIIKNLR
jgi:MFS transporter, DHA3 family, macrolide efflux protein